MGSSQPEDGTHKAIPEVDAPSTQAVDRLAVAILTLAKATELLAYAYAGQLEEQPELQPTQDMAGRSIG